MPRRPKGDGKLTTDDQPKTCLKRGSHVPQKEDLLGGQRGDGIKVQAGQLAVCKALASGVWLCANWALAPPI
jgi:hypothetical protein